MNNVFENFSSKQHLMVYKRYNDGDCFKETSSIIDDLPNGLMKLLQRGTPCEKIK